jgi:CRISPR-associated endonuclease Csn1
VSKIKLADLKISDLENMVGMKRDRHLYEALKKRLQEFDNDAKKAFAENFYKPTSYGKNAPVVRSIRVYDNTISGIEVRGGKAANGEMVRVDVYTKSKKFFLVPHYVDDIARKRVKMHAIAANKDETEWDRIDDSYEFCFSLFKNDLVRVVDSKGKEIFGYYMVADRATSAITIEAHDNSWAKSERPGVKTSKLFEKYVVTPLGEYYRVENEKPPTGKNELENSSDS